MVLAIKDVSKVYGQKRVLDNFSLQLQPGVLGLLGPNGAGKSTLMKMIATVEKPTSGELTWNGVNIAESPNQIRSKLGFLPQDFGVYPNLNVVEFLEYMAAIKGLPIKAAHKRINKLLEALNLSKDMKRSLGTYSGGMKQRVGKVTRACS